MRNHLVALCLAALVLAVMAGVGMAQTWPFFRGNVEGTGVVGVQLQPPFALQWKYETDAALPASGQTPAEMSSTPASDGKNVYFGSGRRSMPATWIPAPSSGSTRLTGSSRARWPSRATWCCSAPRLLA